MYIRQREQRWSPLMLVDSEPNDECDHSQNWVMVGKAKQNKGGVKQVSNPHVKGTKTTPVYLSDMEYSHLPLEGPLPLVEGWLHILQWRQLKWKLAKKPELTARAWGCALQRKRGVSQMAKQTHKVWNPLVSNWVTELNTPGTKQNLWTAIDSIVIKGLQKTILLKHFYLYCDFYLHVA